jgi:hypothetical protein
MACLLLRWFSLVIRAAIEGGGRLALPLQFAEMEAALFLFLVAAELVAEGGEELVAEVGFAARAEAIEEGSAKDGGGNGFVDGGLDGPTAFAGV